MKLKIAYVVSTLRRSGPTNQLRNIIRNLNGEEFESVVITLSPEPADSMGSLFLEDGIPVLSLKKSRINGLLSGLSALRKMLRDIKADVIHTQGIRADLMALRLKEWKSVSTQRNDPFVDYLDKYGRIQGGLMGWMQMKVMIKGRNIYACSASLSSIYKKKYRLDIPYVQNGVDTDHFSLPDAENKKAARQRLGLDPDRFTIVTVGSHLPRKNHEASIIGANHCGFPLTLIILGRVPRPETLLALAAEQVEVLIPGLVSDVRPFFAASDIFVSSSRSEGLPNAVLEAMACGLPPVLSDIEQHREIFTGLDWPYFFDVDKTAQLGEKMGEFRAKDTKGLSDEVREIVLDRFSAAGMSAKYQKIYKALWNGNQ
jgi:glycosyltransferase involved in cell wall biosynthesis